MTRERPANRLMPALILQAEAVQVPRETFHERFATRARARGNTSAEFHAAAQKYAAAAFVHLLIGAIAWDVASWVWALIPFALAVVTTVQCVSATMVAARVNQ